jgi:2,3-bisphosphoglycerate-independent phosphoglycerate mutase
MDRDQRWERTERAYRMLTSAEGERVIDPVASIKESYERGLSDEFIEPMVVTRARDEGEPVATIEDGDSVIFFNFRADRARQITAALTQPGFDGFDTPARPAVEYVCFAEYDKTFNLPVAFPKTQPYNILSDVFAAVGVRNYRMAETEKYAHVTYFFNGGTEREYPHERRLLIPSPKVATYDLAPEMSAFKLTDKILRAIEEGETDAFIVNFANPDMVGHTGNLEKTIEAVQYVDTCLGWIMRAMRTARGRILITADHGNCEQMIDPTTGQPHTAHTTNLVPFHLVDEAARGLKLREGGALEDVAPTMLGLLGLEKPAEMTGRDLREL